MENLKLAPEDYLNMAQSVVAGVLEQCGARRGIEVEWVEATGEFLIETMQPKLFYQIMAWEHKGAKAYTLSSHKRSSFDSKTRGWPNKPVEIVGHTDFLGILVTLKKTLEGKR